MLCIGIVPFPRHNGHSIASGKITADDRITKHIPVALRYRAAAGNAGTEIQLGTFCGGAGDEQDHNDKSREFTHSPKITDAIQSRYCSLQLFPAIRSMYTLPFFDGENMLPCQGEVLFFPDFIAQELADRYFNDLQTTVAWKQEPVKLFGREIMQPRLTAWYGDAGKSYSYSGITMQPQPWTGASLPAIKKAADELAGVRFNSALLNLYRDGSDSMGWHRDNEKELGHNPVIASVSLGAARRFLLRNYADKKLTREIMLTHGSLLLMRGETQHYWEHSIPKTAKPTGRRINITFRTIQ